MTFKVDNIQKKIVLYIVIITIPMFMASLFLIQNYVSSELLKSEYRQAKLININTLKNIESFLEQTSRFTRKATYMIEGNPKNFQAILPFLKESISKNSARFGSALALDSLNYLHKYYCKYYYRNGDSIDEKWLMPPAYNYSQYDWYRVPKAEKKPIWSEPYFDKGGGNVFMSTFSFPILDRKQKFLGVVTADIELNTLSKRIQQLNKGKEGALFLFSKKGFILSHPDSFFNLKKNVIAYANSIHSQSLMKAGIDITKGISGVYNVKLPDGKYTLHTMYVSRTSWTIGIFLKDSVLFKPLKNLKIYLLIIMLADLFLIMIMVILVSKQLKSNVAKEEKAKHELELANRIQQHFLPKINKLKNEEFSLDGLMIPAKEVGGDFYGYRRVDEKLIFYVGDVSGKGVPASLFMMASQMLMEDAMDDSCDPAYILNRVNQKILKISTTGMFATMIVGIIDLSTYMLTYSIAGHPPLIIKSEGGIFSPIPIFALPVAAFEEINYQNRTVKLTKGASIIAFSDGVSEAENIHLELYNTDRIAKVLQNCSDDMDASTIKDKLLQNIRTYTNGNEQNDDITIVVVKL